MCSRGRMPLGVVLLFFSAALLAVGAHPYVLDDSGLNYLLEMKRGNAAGFVGMRGKKADEVADPEERGFEEYAKRAGFVGMRGKKADKEEGLDDYNYFEPQWQPYLVPGKRAGFVGMRGKKHDRRAGARAGGRGGGRGGEGERAGGGGRGGEGAATAAGAEGGDKKNFPPAARREEEEKLIIFDPQP